MRPFPTSNTVPPPRPAPSRAPTQDLGSPTDTETETGTAAAASDGRRARTQFYLPSPATNTTTDTDALSRTHSRHHDSGTTMSRDHSGRASGPDATGTSGYSNSISMPASPSHASGSRQFLHRRSRTSLAGLRTALQTYRVPSESDYGTHTPPASSRWSHGHSPVTDGDGRPISELDLNFGTAYSRGGRLLDYGHDHGDTVYGNREDGQSSEGSRLRMMQFQNREMLRSPLGLGQEMMDALVEIHRVLYRGREDMQSSEGQLKWDEQGKEVRRVVERWFEGDCSESTIPRMPDLQQPTMFRI